MNRSGLCRISFSILAFLALAAVFWLNSLIITTTKREFDAGLGKKIIDEKPLFQLLEFPFLKQHANITPVIKLEKNKCFKPILKFVFVKTHKTGSSTTTKLLSKFMNKHNVSKLRTVGFPQYMVGGYPGRFKCKFSFPKGSEINVQHVRFDADEMKRCFHPDTRYFTIIRKPWDNFLSSYNFFPKMNSGSFHCDQMPSIYVNQGEEADTAQFLSKAATLLNSSVPFYFRYRNSQSYDLGFDSMLDDDKEIKRQIQELDKHMDLVMLLEYLEESLILLKDLLCCDWDVVSNIAHVNERNYDRKSLTDEQEKKNFQQLYNIDIALYDYFNKTFWNRVDAYGRDKMAKDLEILRHRQNKRSPVKPNRLPSRVNINSSLKAELQNYMFENNGKCMLPGWKEPMYIS